MVEIKIMYICNSVKVILNQSKVIKFSPRTILKNLYLKVLKKITFANSV